MRSISLADLPTLSEAELQTVYEGLGFRFVGEEVVLDIAGKNGLILKKSVFLKPSREDLRQLTEAANLAFGDGVELLDPADDQYERMFNGERTRQIGRILDHK